MATDVKPKYLRVAGALGRAFGRLIIFAVKVYTAAGLLYLAYRVWQQF